MPKGYFDYSRASQTYEIVQLLRLNGALVTLDPDGRIRLRMKRKGNMHTIVLTHVELKERFGPGTLEHSIMLRHERAGSIVKANIPKRKKHKHQDLIA